MNRIRKLAVVIVVLLSSMAANAIPIAPTPIIGNVTLGAPDSNFRILGSVDFGFAFDTSGVNQTEWDRLEIYVKFTLDPDAFLSEWSVTFRGVSNNRTFSASDLNADGTTYDYYKGLPGFHPTQLAAFSTVQYFEITPIEDYLGEPYPYGVEGPTALVTGLEMTIVDRGGGGGVHPVPEPGTLALLGIGILGMGAARRRKKA